MNRTMMYRAPAPGAPMRSVRARRPGLRFSEGLLLAGLAWAYFFSISDPLFDIPLQVTSLRHFPLVVLIPAMVLQLFAVGIFSARVGAAAVLKVVWPLLVLAVWITAASLVAKYEYAIQDTFLTFGVYVFLLPLLAVAPARPEAQKAWMRAIAVLWVVVALVALAGELARLPKTQKLHEIEYVVLSGFFLLWFLYKSPVIRALAIVLIATAIIANYKLTGAILGAAGLGYLALAAGWQRVKPEWRLAYLLIGMALAVIVGTVLVLLYFEFRAVLPTGNPEVRLNQYSAAWQQFLASPVWGSSYLDGSGEAYREATRLYNIPTHSDVLDHLKHGGVIGLGLFLLGYFQIFRVIVRAALFTRGDRLMHAYFSTVAMFQVGALITFSLNPLLLKGPYLIVILGNLGLALGLALSVMIGRDSAVR